MKGDPRKGGFSTRAIHAGQPPDPTTGAVVVPIYQTSTYVQEELGRHRGFEYSRVANPTRSALEENLAVLEGGWRAHAFASGMAAIHAVLSLVGPGERVVAARHVYGGTHRLFRHILEPQGIRFDWVETAQPGGLEQALARPARLVYLESPANPTLEVTDLAGAAALAHQAGALVAVDNTFMSPYLQRPLELGADLVVHSTTKYLNGHSDSVGGAVVARGEAEAERLGFFQRSAGAILAPFECFLVLRGIKTLAVRMERHEANARAVAEFLAGQPRRVRVLYPGLPEHPGHALQSRQASGFGATVAADLGSAAAAKAFLDRLQVFSLAESLGGVESLAAHPATMTHTALTVAQREELGVTPGLVRLSVGIEDQEDLLVDLERALRRPGTSPRGRPAGPRRPPAPGYSSSASA